MAMIRICCSRTAFLLALALSASGAALAADEKMVFAVTAANVMPLIQIENNVPARGIIKDLGDAIAAALARQAVYLVLPRRRIAEAVVTGEADVRCYVRPQWDDMDVHWSKPLIPNGDAVARRRGAAAPAGLKALAGVRLGGVVGYHYPELATALGEHFVRDDAPDENSNMVKLAAGRFDYAIVNKLALQYFLKARKEGQAIAPDTLPISSFETQCALSRKSRISAAEFDRAVDDLLMQGKVERILARYR
jgi:polar amino acid transport system substrate-binding protein